MQMRDNYEHSQSTGRKLCSNGVKNYLGKKEIRCDLQFIMPIGFQHRLKKKKEFNSYIFISLYYYIIIISVIKLDSFYKDFHSIFNDGIYNVIQNSEHHVNFVGEIILGK